MEALRGKHHEAGVAVRPLAGETSCGDVCVIAPHPSGILFAAVDGLGHGEEAAAAAEMAAAIIRATPNTSLLALMERCHRRLMGTRGAAMSLASFDPSEGTMTWAGVGNVEGLMVRAVKWENSSRESLMLRGGVVGHRMPPLTASIVQMGFGDILILATDGVEFTYSSAKLPLALPPQRLAEHILTAYAKETDDALVLVARFLGGTPP